MGLNSTEYYKILGVRKVRAEFEGKSKRGGEIYILLNYEFNLLSGHEPSGQPDMYRVEYVGQVMGKGLHVGKARTAMLVREF